MSDEPLPLARGRDALNGFIANVAAPLTIVSLAVLVALSLLLVAERARRSGRERRQTTERLELVRLLEEPSAPDPAGLRLAVARRFATRAALIGILRRRPDLLGAVRAQGGEALAAAAIADTTHRDGGRRGAGVELLAQVGGEEQLQIVRGILHGDPDSEVRRCAARGLARRGDQAAAWLLIHALEAGVLPAERILEQLGHPFATEAATDALHLGQLRPVHADLAEALGLARDPRAVFAVARLLRGGNGRERVKACRALGLIGRPEVVPMLIEALVDSNPTVRAVAARSLGEIGDARGVAPLAACVDDHAWWVRANSAEALRHCGPDGVSALHRCLEHPHERVRDRAREALALHAAAVARRVEAA
jgi:HEAT repeat protein